MPVKGASQIPIILRSFASAKSKKKASSVSSSTKRQNNTKKRSEEYDEADGEDHGECEHEMIRTNPLHEKWLKDPTILRESHFKYILVDEIFNNNISSLKDEFSKLSVFKASPTLLDDIVVTIDGMGDAEIDVKSLGQVIIKNPQSLSVRVYDDSVSFLQVVKTILTYIYG